MLPLSEVDILYKLRSILIATYSVGSYVSIKAMVHPPVCEGGGVGGGTATVFAR